MHSRTTALATMVMTAMARWNRLTTRKVCEDCEAMVAEDRTARSDEVFLNPGVRWAFNFDSGLQIVPGIAYTVGLADADGADGLFLYLSFEHPFRR